MANSQKARRMRATIAPPLQAANEKPAEQGPNIDYTRSEVSDMYAKWDIVNDCLMGQNAVKRREDVYLPRPNALDKSEHNKLRYMNYIIRAVFYNVTYRTLEGLIGQVFSRDPILQLPDSLKGMVTNIDGEGVSLDQQSKKGLAYNLAYGGFGLFVDYPKTDGLVSVADQQSGKVRPTITQYHRKAIINWRHIKRGADYVLSLVVIKEKGVVSDDGFEQTCENQWRVLQLINGVYTVSVWHYVEETESYEIVSGPIQPTRGDGKTMDTIPFFFCGVTNNNASPDEPPMYHLAELNIAHYRNSADYEDSCYMVGQPTPVFSGLTKQWVQDVFKGQPIQLGSRGSVALPVGGTATMLQANPNSMPKEAMDQKEAQMAALGAKLIKEGGGKNTLGEAQLDESTETSLLSTAAKNVSLCYTLALIEAAKMHAASEDIEYSLNTDFPASRLTPNERTQLVSEWQAGAITRSEMRAGLRKAGVATLDLDDYEAEVKKFPPPEIVAMENNQGKGGADNEPKKNKDADNNGGNQNNV